MTTDSALNDTYRLTEARHHLLFKEMWGGSAKLGAVEIYTIDSEWAARKEQVVLSERFVKCIDEILTNCADHHQRTAGLQAPHRMTKMDVWFDTTTGRVFVSNDGDGFDVAVHPEDPKKRYIPEIITTEVMRGRNFIKEQNATSAGTNGVGSKLANSHSIMFTLETVDIYRKLVYRQTTHNHIETIDAPVVGAMTANIKPHTSVDFVMDYAALGWGYIDPADPEDRDTKKPASRRRQCTFSQSDAVILERVIRMRVCQLAISMGAKIAVTFNGVAVPYKTLQQLAKAMYPDKELHVGKAKWFPPLSNAEKAARKAVADKKTPTAAQQQLLDARKAMQPIAEWDIVVVLPMDKAEQISFVNNVVCTGGPHLDQIKEDLHAKAKERAADLFPDGTKYHGQMMNLLAVMMVGLIPNATWGGGQLKTSISMPAAQFRELQLPPKLVKGVCEELYNRMLLTKGQPKRTARTKIRAKKYEPATKLGAQATLLIAEGDSAANTVDKGRTNKSLGFGTDSYGKYILGGVPINVVREVDVRRVDGQVIVLQKKKLLNNVGFNELVSVIGLDFSKTYVDDADLKTLHYGKIVLAVDEDLDGKGNIAGLFLSNIYTFWPALIQRGFIARMRTPVVRIFPQPGAPADLQKRNGVYYVREFYEEAESDEWLETVKRERGEDVANKFKALYYKGLGGHSDDQIKSIFSKFQQNVLSYGLDTNAPAVFAMYYAADTAPRKIEFSTPVRELTDDERAVMTQHKIMPCTTQLQIHTKQYKLDNMTRKLPSIADGLVVTRRRVLAGAIKKFGYVGANTFVKIFQFGGFVAEHMFYHHGDASLYECITHMAEYFEGGALLPLLERDGQFGSRKGGSKDASSPRYIGVRLNRPLVKVTFPDEDGPLLNYMVEEGERSIPTYFVPIVPMVLFRPEKIPADGWQYIMWARDVPATIAVVKSMIRADQATVLSATFHLPPARVGFTGEHKMYGDKEYALGTYKIITNAKGEPTEIVVTELPPRIWTTQYAVSFCKTEETKTLGGGMKKVPINEFKDEYKELFIGDKPIDETNAEGQVWIRFRLRPGALQTILTRGNDIGTVKEIEHLIDADDDDADDDNADDDNDADADADNADEPKQKTVKTMVGSWHHLGDPIQRFFGLVMPMNKSLNMIGTDGAVKEFKTYEDVLRAWYPIRRAMWQHVIYRRCVLMSIEIRYLREKLRFCHEFDKLGLDDKRLTIDKMNERMANANVSPPFDRVDNALYREPGFADKNPTEKLEELTFNSPKAEYNYLLNMNTLDRSIEGQKKLENKINEVSAELKMLTDEAKTDQFWGASEWLRQLDVFLDVYQKGVACKWDTKTKKSVDYGS